MSQSMTGKYNHHENAFAEGINRIAKNRIFHTDLDFSFNNQRIDSYSAITLHNSLEPHLSNHLFIIGKMHKQLKR